MRSLILIFSILNLTSCHKDVPNYKTLKELAKTAGMISECKLNGETVYEICAQLSGCKTIYCVENNIWGEPAVDVYGLN
ncbi:MAG: hypothetical protein ACKO5N_00155 [Sphingomonadales bacterium]